MIATRKHIQDGFSFIEIVVVLLIMGLLIGIAGPLAFRWVATGKVNTTMTNLKTLKGVITQYQMEQGKYPTKLEDLTNPPKGQPYMEDIPADGWGNEFVYKVTSGKKHPFELYSQGDPGDEDAERIDAWELGKKK